MKDWGLERRIYKSATTREIFKLGSDENPGDGSLGSLFYIVGQHIIVGKVGKVQYIVNDIFSSCLDVVFTNQQREKLEFD